MTTARALAATTATAIVLAALAGCGLDRASSEPATPDPAQVRAQEEAAKAAAFKESEEAIRALEVDSNANPSRPAAGWYADPVFVDEQQQFFDQIKKQQLVIKGSSKLETVEPVDFRPAPLNMVAMRVCSTVTGGIYDSKGRNVTTTPEGKPLTDKERRIASLYSMHKSGHTGRWQIRHVEQEGKC